MTVHTCRQCGHEFAVDGDADVHCPKCDGSACMNQAVRNALEDLETAAGYVKNYADSDSDYDADMIRESVGTIREELGDG